MAINLSGFNAWTPEASKTALSGIGYTGSNADADQQSYLKSLYGQGESKYGDLYNYQAARRTLDPLYQLKANEGIDLGSWQPPTTSFTGGTLPTSGPLNLPSGGGVGFIGSTPVASAVNGNAPAGGLLTSAAPASTATPAVSGAPAATGAWGPQAHLDILRGIGFTGQSTNDLGNKQGHLFLKQLEQQENWSALTKYEQERRAKDPTYSLAQEGITPPPGVLPNTVQDFNSVQNTALDNLAKGAPDTGFTSQMPDIYKQMLEKIQGAANSAPYNPATATAAYMDPYQQQVINAYDTQATAGFDKLANQIAARNARNGNAGGSSESNMLGGAATDILNNRNRDVANLLSGGWNNAVTNSQNDFYKNLANKYSGANAMTGALSTGQGLDQYLTGQYYNQNNIALGAGDRVQTQNQRQLDAANGTQQADLAYQLQMLGILRDSLTSYPGGTATSSTTPGNMLGGAAGGAATGLSLWNNYNNGNALKLNQYADPSLPWSTGYTGGF